jgi:hypothetical protein
MGRLAEMQRKLLEVQPETNESYLALTVFSK